MIIWFYEKGIQNWNKIYANKTLTVKKEMVNIIFFKSNYLFFRFFCITFNVKQF